MVLCFPFHIGEVSWSKVVVEYSAQRTGSHDANPCNSCCFLPGSPGLMHFHSHHLLQQHHSSVAALATCRAKHTPPGILIASTAWVSKVGSCSAGTTPFSQTVTMHSSAKFPRRYPACCPRQKSVPVLFRVMCTGQYWSRTHCLRHILTPILLTAAVHFKVRAGLVPGSWRSSGLVPGKWHIHFWAAGWRLAALSALAWRLAYTWLVPRNW